MVSVVVVSRLSCSSACGIFPDQESNLCFLHWPLSHQGSPLLLFLKTIKSNMTVFIALGGIPKIKNEWNLNLHLVCTFLERTEKGEGAAAIYFFFSCCFTNTVFADLYGKLKLCISEINLMWSFWLVGLGKLKILQTKFCTIVKSEYTSKDSRLCVCSSKPFEGSHNFLE